MNQYFLFAFVIAPAVVITLAWIAVRLHERTDQGK